MLRDRDRRSTFINIDRDRATGHGRAGTIEFVNNGTGTNIRSWFSRMGRGFFWDQDQSRSHGPSRSVPETPLVTGQARTQSLTYKTLEVPRALAVRTRITLSHGSVSNTVSNVENTLVSIKHNFKQKSKIIFQNNILIKL